VIERLEAMIAATRALRDANRAAGRQIEAAACAIREKALAEALAVVKAEGGR
jgi:hypothetical protein